MYSNLRRMIDNKLSQLPLYTMLRSYIDISFTKLQNGLMLMGWVVLGLGLIALLVEVLASFPGWFGPIFFGPQPEVAIMEKLPALPTTLSKTTFHLYITNRDVFPSAIIPVLGAIVLYIVLTIVQTKLFPWPQRRVAYLLALSTILLTAALTVRLELLPVVIDRFAFCIITYAIVAHTRVTLGKRAGWLVEAIVLVAAMASITAIERQGYVSSLPPNLPGSHIYQAIGYQAAGAVGGNPDQLLLHIPMLGIQIGGTIQLFQATLWVLGLLCLHIFTGVGMHERAARQRSDRLVKELTRAQEQLRLYALHAEELATMRERTRVAREVHDTLAQGLAAIKMHLETGTKVFDDQPALAQKHMERARELAGAHLNETRNSILNLRSDALDGRTLPVALAALVAAWQPVYDPCTASGQATFCVSDMPENSPFWQTLPPAVELACYRIAQEALSNASRHGQAQHVDVELSLENSELCLTITDDGAGFDPATTRPGRKAGSFGIIGMHERLKLLNGRLEIISAVGAGTQVVAMIPLQSAGAAMELVGQRERLTVNDPHLARR
jgi:signal transduction histidine kinase